MSNLYLTPYLKYVTAKRDSSTHTKWNKYFKIEKKNLFQENQDILLSKQFPQY